MNVWVICGIWLFLRQSVMFWFGVKLSMLGYCCSVCLGRSRIIVRVWALTRGPQRTENNMATKVNLLLLFFGVC